MKLRTSFFLAALAMLPFAAQAQDDQGNSADAEQARLVKVATLSTVEANQEFQRNVQIMQGLRKQAMDLKAAIDDAATESERASLEAELEELVERLNENNQKMIEAYGFSLTRNYVLVIEQSHIYMSVSEEEAERIKERLEQEGVETGE